MSTETIDITPLPVNREEIITEGGIPAEIFDYLNHAIEDPDTLKAAMGLSYWFPTGWQTMREIWTKEKHPLVILLDGDTESIRVINTNVKKAWLEPVFRGSLTLEGAQGAIAALRELTAV